MKKYIIFLALLFVVMFSYAAEPRRFNDARRFVEFGFNVGAATSNNYFGLGDFFQDTLVIDFNTITKELSDEGLALDFGTNEDFYSNFNFRNFGFGLFTNTDANVYSTIPKSIFEIMAKGNSLGKTYTGDLNIRADVTIETGAWFGTRINTPIGKIGFTVKPAYFIPVIHVYKPTTSYSVLSGADGNLTATGKVDIPVYTGVPGSLVESGGDVTGSISDMLSSGGMDIALTADYPLFPVLTVGAEIKGLPLFPARMKYRTRLVGDFTMAMDPVLADVDKVQSGDFMSTTQNYDFFHDEKNLLVFRPFKIGVNAVYMPFKNKILTLHPNLDLAIYDGVYADVGVKLQTNLANIFIFKISSNLEDLMWKEKAGFILNARVLELELAAGGQSQDFLKSFTGSGFSVMAGLRFGF